MYVKIRTVNDPSPVLLLFSVFRSEAGLRVSSVPVNGGRAVAGLDGRMIEMASRVGE